MPGRKEEERTSKLIKRSRLRGGRKGWKIREAKERGVSVRERQTPTAHLSLSVPLPSPFDEPVHFTRSCSTAPAPFPLHFSLSLCLFHSLSLSLSLSESLSLSNCVSSRKKTEKKNNEIEFYEQKVTLTEFRPSTTIPNFGCLSLSLLRGK